MEIKVLGPGCPKCRETETVVKEAVAEAGVSADIETRYRTNVLAVPIQCVTRRAPGKPPASAEDSGSKTNRINESPAKTIKADKTASEPREVVFLARDGKAVMAAVTRGISDDDYVEITEGLKDGDTVITGDYRAIDRELKEDSLINISKKETGKKNDS